MLVNSVPEDLSNGIVFNHLIGYIVCSQVDRDMIFNLVHYPLEGHFDLTDQNSIKNNMDLAYNVLKHSTAYVQNVDLQFLSDENEEQGINPTNLSRSRYLVEFL